MQLNDRAFDALERTTQKAIERAVAYERESIALMIEKLDDGPLTTKAVKAYIAATIRNRSCEE